MNRVYNRAGRPVSEADGEKKHVMLSDSPFDSASLKQHSYSTDAQAVGTQIARTPATQYLSLNSRDRNQTSALGVYTRQPWNQFRLQRPQNILNSFATRMLVTEINFPYYVTNINPLTNKFWLVTLDNDDLLPTLFQITLVNGFLNPTEIKDILNDVLNQVPGYTAFGSITPIAGGAGVPLSPPIVTLLANGSFQWSNGGGNQPFALYYSFPTGWPAVTSVPTESQYNSSASLMSLMGMDHGQVIGQTVASPGGVQGNPTTCQYTQYVDIVSDKLHQYSTNRDGSTDNFFGRNLICRLYISDETSDAILGVDGPCIIHRQFKTPKAVMWNKEASVDWLDIAVFDQYGNLLPVFQVTGSPGVDIQYPPPFPSYPDFQISLQASEN